MSDNGIHEHTARIREQYPHPLYPLLIELAEYNREEWLSGPKGETIGAEEVRKTGLTGMERELANELKKRLERYEEWACDKCGVRNATCTRGPDGPSLCNDCAFGDGRTDGDTHDTPSE